MLEALASDPDLPVARSNSLLGDERRRQRLGGLGGHQCCRRRCLPRPGPRYASRPSRSELYIYHGKWGVDRSLRRCYATFEGGILAKRCFLRGPPLPHTRDNGPEPEAARRSALPEGTLPRGLSRSQAAAYVGVSPTTFNRMIVDKLMPEPIRIYGRTVWDIRKLDAAFAALDTSADADKPWSRMSL